MTDSEQRERRLLLQKFHLISLKGVCDRFGDGLRVDCANLPARGTRATLYPVTMEDANFQNSNKESSWREAATHLSPFLCKVRVCLQIMSMLWNRPGLDGSEPGIEKLHRQGSLPSFASALMVIFSGHRQTDESAWQNGWVAVGGSTFL